MACTASCSPARSPPRAILQHIAFREHHFVQQARGFGSGSVRREKKRSGGTERAIRKALERAQANPVVAEPGEDTCPRRCFPLMDRRHAVDAQRHLTPSRQLSICAYVFSAADVVNPGDA